MEMTWGEEIIGRNFSKHVQSDSARDVPHVVDHLKRQEPGVLATKRWVVGAILLHMQDSLNACRIRASGMAALESHASTLVSKHVFKEVVTDVHAFGGPTCAKSASDIAGNIQGWPPRVDAVCSLAMLCAFHPAIVSTHWASISQIVLAPLTECGEEYIIIPRLRHCRRQGRFCGAQKTYTNVCALHDLQCRGAVLRPSRALTRIHGCRQVFVMGRS